MSRWRLTGLADVFVLSRSRDWAASEEQVIFDQVIGLDGNDVIVIGANFGT